MPTPHPIEFFDLEAGAAWFGHGCHQYVADQQSDVGPVLWQDVVEIVGGDQAIRSRNVLDNEMWVAGDVLSQVSCHEPGVALGSQADIPPLWDEPLLIVRRTLREQFCILHRRLLAIVRDDEVCRRLMTTPGVGPVVSLTYRATVDVPARFRKSKSVGAGLG